MKPRAPVSMLQPPDDVVATSLLPDRLVLATVDMFRPWPARPGLVSVLAATRSALCNPPPDARDTQWSSGVAAGVPNGAAQHTKGSSRLFTPPRVHRGVLCRESPLLGTCELPGGHQGRCRTDLPLLEIRRPSCRAPAALPPLWGVLGNGVQA
jgi:hypothetical protein